MRGTLAQVVAKRKRDHNTIMRRSAADAGGRVPRRTPVDTGRARRSWTPALNRRDESNSGGDIAATANAMRPGDRFTLTSSLPYIRALEYGHSDQAPGGMVHPTAAEWLAIVRRAARGL